MTKHEASRTLVKSPPELWAEISDPASLGGHLAEPFGEIRITRVDPETAVAWEGERASGTVRIEPSGWGTRVTLTATAVPAEPPAPPPSKPAPDPVPAAVGGPRVDLGEAHGRGLRGRLLGWLRAAPTEGVALPAPPAKPVPADPGRVGRAAPATAGGPPAVDPDAALARVLDDLGAAHHRPFSRS